MIRVLLVEDSATARARLRSILESSGKVTVAGEAATGKEAIALAAQVRPQVVSLDVFLPDMPAAEVVREILARRTVPIVLVSEASRQADEAFEALSAGALEWIRKPRAKDLQSYVALLESLAALDLRPRPTREDRGAPEVILIGSSTGGPAALRSFLTELAPRPPAPVVVAQHLSEGFDHSLAGWLSTVTRCKVRVAKDGEALAEGEVLLGPPAHDIEVLPTRKVRILPAPQPLGFHPSADVLFASGAGAFGSKALAIVLSGIGQDGARGARVLSAVGGTVMAQDAVSAAVNGMPGTVARSGVASMVGPPEALARALLAGPRVRRREV